MRGLAWTLGLALIQAAPGQEAVSGVVPRDPVMMFASDFDPCSYGKVSGLRARGDGYLAVRSVPSASGAMLDRLHNGRPLWICDDRGAWLGVVYPAAQEDCAVNVNLKRSRPYHGRCRSGWVHSRWVRLIAG